MKKLLDADEVDNIIALAEKGDLDKIDLRVRDITPEKIIRGMPEDLTAASSLFIAH